MSILINTPSSNEQESTKGYQNNKTLIHSIPQLFKHSYDYITSPIISINSEYPSKIPSNNYIITMTNDSLYNIHVVEFKISADNQIEICKEYSYDLQETANLNNFDMHPLLYAIKSETSFLVLVRIRGIWNLYKFDIESGAILWSKENFTTSNIIEDERGILYTNSIVGNCIMLYDTKTGSALSKISVKFGCYISNSIGIDFDNNFIVTYNTSDYYPRIGVVSKNGKWLKTLPFSFYSINILNDPYNKKLYLPEFSNLKTYIYDSKYNQIQINDIIPEIRRIEFVKNCKFMLMIDKRGAYLYD